MCGRYAYTVALVYFVSASLQSETWVLFRAEFEQLWMHDETKLLSEKLHQPSHVQKSCREAWRVAVAFTTVISGSVAR